MDFSALADFSNLIGKIYDAALADEAWKDALDGICVFLNAQTAALNAYDLFDRKPPWQWNVGYDPQWMQIYIERYLAMNPYMDDVAALAAGECAYSSARPDYRELQRTEFYQGWLRPQGFVDGSVLMIHKTSSQISTLVNVRNDRQGLFDASVMDRLKAIYPHIRRAVVIGRIIADHQAQSARLAAVMDALAAGVFILGRNGKLLHANEAGSAMLAARSPVVMLREQLSFVDDLGARTLRDACSAAAVSWLAMGGRGGAIPLTGRGGASFMAHMLPLSQDNRTLIEAPAGAAFVLFIKRNDPADALTIGAFARRFGLTAKETEVLGTIIDAGGVPLAAEVLGLSATTVRSHLTSIFDKTGVRRQADLIQMLMAMRSPFADKC